jgi:glycosyltransferase involved in cell wall biosynthesis
VPDRVPRIALITRDAPPRHCGVGDHSICLADALVAQGAEVHVLAFEGNATGPVATGTATDAANWLAWVEREVSDLGIEHVVLQYTPLYYQDIPGWSDDHLLRWWAALAERHDTALVVHETYHRSVRQPLSLVTGTRQKRTLERLARTSACVFTASECLATEMKDWDLQRPPVLLPIGSNLPLVAGDRAELRARYAIANNDLVLTLFGGGNSLKWMAQYVNAVSKRLSDRQVAQHWLLLGGVPATWFHLSGTTVIPGRLPAESLSAHLAMTDLFLMPHSAGVCAKRGTLMAAMQHGLPVVGTRGPMTDPFWDRISGVLITRGIEPFVAAVARLATDPDARIRMGKVNERHYHAFFDWPHIARTVLANVRAPRGTSQTFDGSVASI